MARKAYWANDLIGGTTGAADKIPTADLLDKYMVHPITATLSGHYSIDDDSAAAESSPWVIAPDDEAGDKRLILVDIVAPNAYAKLFKGYDTNFSHTLTYKWNEDDSADRTLNLKVNAGNRTLDVAENLKILDGQDIELHASGGEKAQLAIDTQNAERTLDLSANLTIPAAPGADRLLGWDHSELATAYFQPDGSTLEISTTNLRVKDAGITYAKIQNVSATDKLLGRSSAEAGVVEEIACTAAGRALLDDANAAAQLVTLGFIAAITELNYTNGVTSAIQTQLDARCLESVFGTAIGTGLLLDGTDLKVSTILQKYHAIDPSANVQSLLGAASYAAMRTLLDLEAETDFYSIAAADEAFQHLDSDLTSLAALGTAADKMAYTTEAHTWAEAAITAAGRSMNAAANAAAQLALLSGQAGAAFDLNLQNLTSVGTIGCGAIISTGNITAQGGSLYLGQDDSEYGRLYIYGDGAGSHVGGFITFHTPADYDTNVDYYYFSAYDETFYISRTGFGDLTLDKNGNFNIVTHNGSTVGLKLGGTLITATAAEINTVCDGGQAIGTGASPTFVKVRASGVQLTHNFYEFYDTTDSELQWSLRIDDDTDPSLQFYNNATPNAAFYFTNLGVGKADIEWSTFSPDIVKDKGIENPTADDYLNWALEDALKPVKPYRGLWSNSDEKEAKQKRKVAESFGVHSREDEERIYGKGLGKIAIGTARWAQGARERISFLESEIARLEELISSN